jgi:hypothetical protein
MTKLIRTKFVDLIVQNLVPLSGTGAAYKNPAPFFVLTLAAFETQFSQGTVIRKCSKDED